MEAIFLLLLVSSLNSVIISLRLFGAEKVVFWRENAAGLNSEFSVEFSREMIDENTMTERNQQVLRTFLERQWHLFPLIL